MVFGGAAPTLTSGFCQEGCTECRSSWWSNDPSTIEYHCVDDTVYKYGNECGSRDRSMCMTDSDQKCHRSYPDGDADKFNSVDSACRTVPADYIEGDWNFSRKSCNNSQAGLCYYGCASSCNNSYPNGSSLKWNDPKAMCRCQ
jgi:hypothetical protein